MIFWYLDGPHRTRHVAASTHPVPELVEVAPLVAAELGDADLVHTRRTSVGPDLLPRLIDQAFGDLKRLHLQLRFALGFIPVRVDRRVHLICPTPSLQPHYRAFTATTSRSAPVPRIGTLPLPVSAGWGSPCCGQRADLTHWPSVSRRQVLLFHASARDELTPPSHRTSPGPHTGRSPATGAPSARRCPRATSQPRFRCRRCFCRCVISGSLTFVFSSHT